MGKNALLVGGILLILIVGIAGFIFVTNNNNSSPQTPAPINPTPLETNNNSYVEYSPTVLSDTNSTNQVLFFYANWCPTCRPADVEFQNRSNEIPDGTTLVRVNYNDSDTDESEKTLAEKYNVTYQHTFVQINSNGEAVNTWNGGGVDKLNSEIK